MDKLVEEKRKREKAAEEAGLLAPKTECADKTNLDNVATEDGADDEAPAKPNTTKKAVVPVKKWS